MVSVKNRGTGPEGITNLEIIGNVPNPVSQGGHDESGIFDTENGYGEVISLVVGAGEEVRFYSSTHPFAERGSSCSDGDFQVNLRTEVLEESVSERYSVRYQNGNQEDCSITIQEAE